MRRSIQRSVIAFVAATLVAAGVGAAPSAAEDGGLDQAPAITSDQADYSPGSLVTLTGSAWAAGEGVDIFVNDDVGKTWSYSAHVVADDAGAFVDAFTLPDWFVATYSVLATGESGRTATTTFTDGTQRIAAVSGATRLGVAIDWQHFANTTCTTPNNGSGTATTTTSGSDASLPVDNNTGQSVRFTAPTPVTIGGLVYTFSAWDGGATTASVCVTGGNGTQTKTATYTHVNVAPTATDDTVTATEDTFVSASKTDLLTNDSDGGDGGTLTLTAVSGATGGTVQILGSNVRFTPTADLCGAGAGGYDYTVSDGTDTDTGHVTVNITCVNDPPVAVDDDASGTEDTTLTIAQATLLANDTDVDGPSKSLTAVGTPAGGTVSIVGTDVRFVPTANLCGTNVASFSYTVSDGSLSDIGVVTIDLDCVNDPPVAVDDDASGSEDTDVVIAKATLLGNDSDPDGDTVVFDSLGSASGGSVVVDGTDLRFTPTADLCGLDVATFDYTISDGHSGTDSATVTIDLSCSNDPPVAVDDDASGAEDTTLTIAQATLLGNDTDVDGPSKSLTAVSSPSGGTVSIVGTDVQFVPTADLCGLDVAGFDYTVSDGSSSDIGHVTIDVSCSNDPPVAVDDDASGTEDTDVVVAQADLVSNDTDADDDTLDLGTLGSSSGGTASIVGTDVKFVPTANLCGDDIAWFDYTVSDGNGGTDTGRVTIDLTCVNDPPVAVDDDASGTEDTTLTIAQATLLGNDTDVDGPSKSLTAVSSPSGGTVSIVGTDVRFVPTANLCGDDAGGFDYTVSDGSLEDTGHVTVDLECVNDLPELTLPGTAGAQYSDDLPTVNLSATDVEDAPGDLVFSVGGTTDCGSTTGALPSGLTLSANDGNGAATIGGAVSAAAGTYPVCIVVTDADDGTDQAVVTITITKENAKDAFSSANSPAMQVSTPGGSLNANALSLVITTEETEPDLPTSTAEAGNIDKAGLSVVLNPVNGGSGINLSCTSLVTGTGYAGVKTFTCTNPSALAVAAYEVVATTTGSYYVGSDTDGFTVYDPSLGFATGGGRFTLEGERVNFGFVMKYGRNGTNLKGSFVAVRHHADGTVSRLKSNALGAMALSSGTGCGTVNFDGKATYMVWDAGSASYVTSGNNAFKVFASDCNEPGTGVDSIWIGGPGDLNMGSAPTGNTATLKGGNIAVPHSAPKQ